MSLVKAAANKVNALPPGSFVKVVSHYDADGISSALILLSALSSQDVSFSLEITNRMEAKVVEEVNSEEPDLVILADLGSSFEGTEAIKPDLVILDHHVPIEFRKRNLLHVNPMFFGEDSLSGSSVAYLFAKFLNGTQQEDLALIGMKGDQRDIAGMNLEIVSRGIDKGRIEKERSLDIFGLRTRPLHQALAMTFDPFFPGISGDESSATQFLSEIGIYSGKERRFVDLDEEERAKLISSLVVRRAEAGIQDADKIVRDVYFVRGYSAEELSTVFNSAGRLGRFHDILEWYVNGDDKIIDGLMREYRKAISESLRKAEERMVVSNGIAVVEASDTIHQNFIGTVVSILKHTKGYRTVIGIGDGGNLLKISVRSDEDSTKILERIMKNDGIFGGHPEAGGGYADKSLLPAIMKRIEEMMKGGMAEIGAA